MGTTLHTLQPPAGARRRKKRIGRGIGSRRGKTSTRGSKGQLARHDGMPAGFEGGQNPLHRRVPKRGFTNIGRVEVVGVNLGRIDKAYRANDFVSVTSLQERGLLPKRAKVVKLLATGEITKPLRIEVHRASGQARSKVEAAGGVLTLLDSLQEA